MANNKDFIVKNAVEVGGSTKVTVGDAASAGSYTSGFADMSTWSYDSVSFSVASEETIPRDVFIKDDGLTMYIIGNVGDLVESYTLSTAWDVSTATYDSKSFSVASQDGLPRGFAFKSDGTKVYIVGATSDAVYQYSLSTAWDVSTGSYDSVSFSVSGQDASPSDIFFKPDGTKMYILGTTGRDINEYNLSTAWDLSTASYSQVSSSISTYEDAPNGMFLKSDGLKLYIIGGNGDEVNEFSLSTAWDVSTISHVGLFSVSSQDTNPLGFTFKPDGTKMYVAGADTDVIYQYSTGSTVTTGSFDLSTGNYFTDTPSADVEYTFSNAGDVQSFQLEVTGNQSVVGYDLANASYDSVNLTLSSPTLEDITAMQFKPDGLKCYLLPVKLSDNIRQCTLSTAWDISTATYDSGKIFDVSSQESSPEGFAFKPDGTKLYVTGISSDAVYQYTLSTAWDISTASYDSVSFSVSAYEATPSDIKFKTDGTRMYVSGRNYIDQYDLSTAWDLSTASYDATSSAISTVSSPYEASIRGISFNTDGTSVFTAGHTDDSVQEFSLATAWDISSTLTHVQTFDTSSQSLNPQFVEFGNNGTKMYVPYPATGTIYQYSTSTTDVVKKTYTHLRQTMAVQPT
jgi:DNA-binding beta-propeller fold protein YncE